MTRKHTILVVAKEYIEERDGGLFVARTRVSLDSVVHCFHAHYLENQAEVDAYRLRQRRRFEEARQAADRLILERSHLTLP